jgi:hypothetical protein
LTPREEAAAIVLPLRFAAIAMKPAFQPSAVVAAALLAALAAGCATDEAKAPAAEAQPGRRGDNTITGSHIPNKKALPPQSDVEREKTVERMKELQKTSQPVQKNP